MLHVKCAREGFKASFLSLTSITYSGLAFTKCLVFMWGWLDGTRVAFTKCLVFMWGWLDGTRVLPSGLVRGWDVLDFWTRLDERVLPWGLTCVVESVRLLDPVFLC